MRCFFAFVLLAIVSSVFVLPEALAGGRRQIETITAEGDETWQHTFDVSEWGTGTHNIIVHARDRAGNEAVSGPFNIRVDPNAALPLARVVHPGEGDVIRQNISVMGVASGRYGIERVMVRLNDDIEAVAVGTDFWERYLDLSRLPDGRHSLHVRAFDEGGLYGPETQVDFILDTSPPSINLTSHNIGDIISGNVTIRGTVSDANGIRSLHFSDEGLGLRPLSMRGRRRAAVSDFSFPIRTGDLPDGPVVYFVRAVDNTGLVTVKPMLFFVSNTPPELEILTPLPEDPLFNTFMLSGRAHSSVGIARIEYQWGRISGEIEARPGDPYWHTVLEQGPGSGNNITVTVTDKAGNSTRVTQRLDDRRRERVPVIVIDYPPPEMLAEMPPDAAIFGRVEMGFGPSSVIIGNNIHSVETFPAFRIVPSRIPVGRNVNFRLSPVDSIGVSGAAMSLRITKAEGSPFLADSRIRITSPELGGWVVGGSVLFEGEAAPFSELHFRLAPNEPWHPIFTDGEGHFSIEVNIAGRTSGPVHLELRTGNDFPIYHPFNKVAYALPNVRFVSPSLEPNPDLPPRLVNGNRTVVGAVEHPVPIVNVAYSLGGEFFTDIPFASCGEKIWFTYFCDFSTLAAEKGQLVFRVTDVVGAEFLMTPTYTMHPEPPLPVIIVNSPVDGQLFTTPFNISGIAYDDVGIRSVRWRILGPTPESISIGEGGDLARLAAEAFAVYPDIEFAEVLTDRTFSIPIDFTMISDGEYTLEIYATDIYGVRSEIASRTIRISTAQPETRIFEPQITRFYNRTITVRGLSLDANGVAEVSFSMDSGNTWQNVRLDEHGDWEISLNTAIYIDGVYSALIRAVDNYGIVAFASAMINIDNTLPDLHLTFPENGQNVGTNLQIAGRVYDNTGLESLRFQIINASNPGYRLDFERQHGGGVILENASIDGFPPGVYIVRVIARDLAGQESIVSREVTFGGGDAQLALFSPFPGEIHSGPIKVVGTLTGSSIPASVQVVMNGNPIGVAPVDRFGIFRHVIGEHMLRDGEPHDISVFYYSDLGELVSSPDHTVFYYHFGPILTIDSHQDGDIVTGRPWLSGRAWVSNEQLAVWEGMAFDGEPVSGAERRIVERELALTSVQVSYDNGHTFIDTRGGRGDSDWRFRIETSELPMGHLPVVVRARFANGTQAVRRVMLYVDTTPPYVQTLTPSEGAAFRESIPVYGIAGVTGENNDLASVDLSLRTGDKMLYSVPGFLQGAFVDFKVFGATYFDVGFGLSFFDDNVRLQAQFGITPTEERQSRFVSGGRYTGNVFGLRLLANIFNLPFSWFLGPDWAFFSMNIAVGANFSWFSMDDPRDRSSLFMSAVIAQWDFANIDMQAAFPNWRFFNNFALYLQPELWFASSDVRGETIFRMSIGLRTNIF